MEINPTDITYGDKVTLRMRDGKIFKCRVIFKDDMQYQCQSEDRLPMAEKWTSLLFYNDSLVSIYFGATVIEHEVVMPI